jgi:hypothetical protein
VRLEDRLEDATLEVLARQPVDLADVLHGVGGVA